MKNIDKAFKRTVCLANIIRAARNDAFAVPEASANFELGLLEPGAVGDAQAELETIFDDLSYIVEYMAILDICAAFESDFRAMLKAALDETRKAVDQGYTLTLFSAIRMKLVRKNEKLKGLGEVMSLVESVMDERDFQQLKILHETRNSVAHGSVAEGVAKLNPTETHSLLADLLEALR